MGAPTRFSQIRENDLGIGDGPVTGEQLKAVVRKLGALLNPGLNALNTLTSKGLSITDNARNDLVTLPFTHGVERQILLVNLKRAASARVLSAESQIVAAVPAVRMIPLSQTNSKPMVGVTIWFNSPTTDGKPSTSRVALELLEEGVFSTSVPTWQD